MNSEYRLEQPTVEQIKKQLVSLLGFERATTVWEETCRQAGFLPDIIPTLEELEHIADIMGKSNDIVGLIGRGMNVRIRTYTILAGKNAPEILARAA